MAKEMGTAAAILNKKKGDERESEEDRYRSVRNLADAIVTFEGQWKLRHGSEPPHMQMLVDARATLDLLKRKARKDTAQQQHGRGHVSVALDPPERAAQRAPWRTGEVHGEQVPAQAPAAALVVAVQGAPCGEVPPAVPVAGTPRLCRDCVAESVPR